MTFKEIPSEINDTDLDVVKRRLAGLPYQAHDWVPLDAGETRFNAARCSKCDTIEYSGKDFCDTDGISRFWIKLRSRRDCSNDIQRNTI